MGLFDDLDGSFGSFVPMNRCFGRGPKGLIGPRACLPDIGSIATSLQNHLRNSSFRIPRVSYMNQFFVALPKRYQVDTYKTVSLREEMQ